MKAKSNSMLNPILYCNWELILIWQVKGLAIVPFDGIYYFAGLLWQSLYVKKIVSEVSEVISKK